MTARVYGFPGAVGRVEPTATHRLGVEGLPAEVKNRVVHAALGLAAMWGNGDLTISTEGQAARVIAALDLEATDLCARIDEAWAYAKPVGGVGGTA